jgi:hypothetical protein
VETEHWSAPGRARERWLLVPLLGFLVYSELRREPAGTVPRPSSLDGAPASGTRSITGIYSEDEIQYFLEVALGGEYGDVRKIVRKWGDDIRIAVVGSPTENDRKALEQVIHEIQGCQRSIGLRLDQESPNLEMVFAPQSEFRRHEPNYVPPNPSFFWVYWTLSSEIHRGRILLDTGLPSQERAHLLREELAQALGLLNTSSRYPESIFNDHAGTTVSRFAPIDKRLIEMLYRPEITPGMKRDQVDELLRRLSAEGGPR